MCIQAEHFSSYDPKQSSQTKRYRVQIDLGGGAQGISLRSYPLLSPSFLMLAKNRKVASIQLRNGGCRERVNLKANTNAFTYAAGNN